MLDYIYENGEEFKTKLNEVLDIVLAFILDNFSLQKFDELINFETLPNVTELIRNEVKSMNNDDFKVSRPQNL